MIPRLRPTLGLGEYVGAFTAGGTVEAFEAAFARTMGQDHAIAFPYGRTALMVLIEALGVASQKVICPAYTCVVVPHAVVYSGNQPVFVDSRREDFNMDLDAAEAAIDEESGALVATSIFGYPVDVDRLDALRRAHPKLRVIQDCAHSFAACWRGRPVQREGDAAVFGLNVSKLITSIFGGMITTSDAALAERLRRLRDERVGPPGALKGALRAVYLLAASAALWPPLFGGVHAIQRLGLIDRFVRYYDPGAIDMPEDYLEGIGRVEAAVGLRQLERYEAIVAHRRQIASVYDEALARVPGLTLPPLVEGATYSHYVVHTPARDALIAAMARRGIELGELIEYSIPELPAYRSYVGADEAFPVARDLSRSLINLPLHVSRDSALAVAGALREEAMARA